jgi:hypothetical protein
MARIPVYQERQQVSQLRAVPELRAPDSGAGLIGRSMQQVGQALGQVAQTVGSIQEENGKAYAMKASGQAKLDMTDYFLKMQETAEPGAQGFTTKFDTEFQSYANKLLEQAPEGAPRRFLASSLSQLRESLMSQSLMYEVSEGRANRFNQISEGIKSTATSLYRNPSQEEYEKSLGEGRAFIDSMNLTPEQRRKAYDELESTLGLATVEGQIKLNPQAFLDSVNNATGSNVDRNKLQNAQISVESGNRPDAISPKGATGLMQVMPTTAMKPGYQMPSIFEFAKSKGVAVGNYTADEAKRLLKNPKLGAEYGQMYMDAMLKEYDGNLVNALVAYNWGPGNANRWIADGADPSKLPEETRNYVPKVLSKAGINASFEGKKVTTGNAAFDNLPFRQQMQYVDKANTRVKQLQAEFRVKLESQVSDANAMALNGIVDERPLTVEDFANAYGPEVGLRNYEVYRDNQTMAADIGMLKTMPLDQMGRKVEAYQPVPGEGFELSQKRYDIVRQAASRVVQMRNDDPVRYAQDTNPDVNAAYQYYQEMSVDSTATMESIGAAAKDYVNKSVAEQQRLGIVEPKILSKVEMDNLSRRIASGDENAANLVMSIEATYGGQYYPQVMNELLAAGKLSNAMIVIADLPEPGAREMVARLANIKQSDLEAGIDSLDIKDIKLNTTAVVQELRASAGPVTQETASTLAAYQEIIQKQALALLGDGGASSPSEAVEKARKQLLGHYQFDGTLRMPANMDSGYIKNGLRDTLPNLYDSLTIVDVPNDLTMAYNANEALDMWKSIIKNRHFWIADNDTEGAFLWARAEDGTSYRVLQGGEQVYQSYSNVIADRIQSIEIDEAAVRDLGTFLGAP